MTTGDVGLGRQTSMLGAEGVASAWRSTLLSSQIVLAHLGGIDADARVGGPSPAGYLLVPIWAAVCRASSVGSAEPRTLALGRLCRWGQAPVQLRR